MFLKNFEQIRSSLKVQKERIIQIIENEEARWAKQKEEASINRNLNYKRVMSTLTDFDINLTRYLQMSILEEHAADLKDDAARKKYMTDRARTMVASQWISKLYAPYYLPEEAEALGPQPAVLDEKWIDLYKKYGFYWPTENDLVQLAMDHPNFDLNDLVVEQVRWKSNSCGFSFIQLVFRKGVTSPVFQTESDKEKGEDYTTTSVRNAGNVRFINVRTHEDKYVEKLQFYSGEAVRAGPVPKE